MDAVKEYKKRRAERIKARMDAEEWITINGTHVMVDEGGKITKGPGSLKELPSDKSVAKQKKSTDSPHTVITPVKESKPVDVKQFKFVDYRNPDGQRMPGYETYRKAMTSLSDASEKVSGRVIRSYSGEMPPAKQAWIEFNNLNNHSAVRDMVGASSEQGLKECMKAIRQRQSEIIKSLEPYTKWNSAKKCWEQG